MHARKGQNFACGIESMLKGKRENDIRNISS